MRIRSVILAALLLLSLGLTAWAHVAVGEQKDAVFLDETVLEGDPADASGVAVELRTECLNQLFWDTALAAGPEGTVRTGYTYSGGKRQSYYYQDREPRGIQFDFWGDSGPTREEETEDEYGMQRPFNDVLSRCPAGTEEYTERVDLSGYYDDFPIYIQDVDILTERVSLYVYGESMEQQVQRELRRCFPIAVPEGTWVEITVSKDADGEPRSYGFSGPENGPWPEMDCVVTEGGCYFTLSASGQGGGAKLDAGRFPLGYGVYFLPVELLDVPEDTTVYGETLQSARLGSIRRVHPIDPGADRVDLYSNADKSLLYLLTQRDGEVALTVLDAADGRAVDTLPLFSDAEAEGDGQDLVRFTTGGPDGGATTTVTQGDAPRPGDLIVQDGFLLPYLTDGRFAVVTWAGEDYGTALTGSFENIYRNGWELSRNDWRYTDLPAVDFDGERLAVADFMYHRSNSFYLALYDREGPVYLASYDSSQDLDGGGYSVEPREPYPLTVALPQRGKGPIGMGGKRQSARSAAALNSPQ